MQGTYRTNTGALALITVEPESNDRWALTGYWLKSSHYDNDRPEAPDFVGVATKSSIGFIGQFRSVSNRTHGSRDDATIPQCDATVRGGVASRDDLFEFDAGVWYLGGRTSGKRWYKKDLGVHGTGDQGCGMGC